MMAHRDKGDILCVRQEQVPGPWSSPAEKAITHSVCSGPACALSRALERAVVWINFKVLVYREDKRYVAYPTHHSIITILKYSSVDKSQ